MTEPQREYTVLTQIHGSQWDDATQRVDIGWTVTYQDAVTGTVGSVFIPDGFYNAQNVHDRIVEQLQHVRDVGALGG